MSILTAFKEELSQAIAAYLDRQCDFFADHELRILDFHFYPWNDGQLLVSCLVVGEEQWQQKARPAYAHYITDWQFGMFSNANGHRPDEIDEVVYKYWGASQAGIPGEHINLGLSFDELFRLFASALKSAPVTAAIARYRLSPEFEVRLVDPDNEEKDYLQLLDGH